MRILNPAAHAEKRGCILAAARSLFARNGYHATSMNEVARACGLAKAAVYHYFTGKDALLKALHEGLLAHAEERLALAPPMRDLREALLYLGRGYMQHFREPAQAEMMRIALNVNAEDPDLLKLSSNVTLPRMEALLDGFVRPYLPKGTPKGKVHEHLLPFFGALFYYRFVLTQICGAGELPDEGRYLEHLADVFSAGVGKRNRSAYGSLSGKA
jgi:AcrR family transcriptional regulator